MGVDARVRRVDEGEMGEAFERLRGFHLAALHALEQRA
jgi:hypothetical protein